MRAEFWAVLTAVCWSVGSLFEKKGMKLGELAPVMGTTIRTVVSLVLMAILSYPFWGQVRTAGLKPLAMVAGGGGLLAGGLGVIFLYMALKEGNLASVMTIAFCLAPVLGTILSVVVLRERLGLYQTLGIVLCVAGAALTVLCKQPVAS